MAVGARGIAAAMTGRDDVERQGAPAALRHLFAHELVAAYAWSIARSGARLAMRRIRRTALRVASDYDEGRWREVLLERRWEQVPSLEAFLVGSGERTLFARIEGRSCRVSEAEYLRYRQRALSELVASSLGHDGTLIELGCGYGYNLFALSRDFPQRRFIGLDISPTGISAGRAIAARFGLDARIAFAPIDLTRPEDRSFTLLSGARVLTFFCLEQIPMQVEGILRRIAAAGPARVLHAEPAAELLSPWRPADWANLLYVRSMHYQTTLLAGLRQLERQREIRLMGVSRLAFAPTIQQVGLAAVWAPNAPE